MAEIKKYGNNMVKHITGKTSKVKYNSSPQILSIHLVYLCPQFSTINTEI